MKKILCILLAVLSLISCSSLIGESGIVGTLMGLLSGDVSGLTSKHLVFCVVNLSDDSITWYVPARGEGDTPGEYGRLPEEKDENEEEFHEIEMGDLDIVMIDEKDDSYEDMNLMTYGPNDTMPIYIFDTEVLQNSEWSEIVAEQKWLDVYWYTAQQMIDLKKTIEYPMASITSVSQ